MAPQHATLGALLIGFTISTSIFGITCLQATQYFRTFRQDRPTLKVMVAIVWLLEVFDELLAGHAVYHYFVIKAGDIRAPAYLIWSLMVPAFTDGLSGMIIQFFFAKRVYIMSESRLLYAVICALAVSQFGLATAVSVVGFDWFLVCELSLDEVLRISHPSVMTLPSYFNALSASTFATVAAVDMIITTSLCYFLHTRKTGEASTDSVVNQIIVITINNGLLSCLIAIAAFVVRIAAPKTMLSFTMCLILSEVYANTLLSSLNARSRSRARMQDPDVMSGPDMPTFIVAKNQSQFGVDSILASGSHPARDTGEDWYKLPALESNVLDLHV